MDMEAQFLMHNPEHTGSRRLSSAARVLRVVSFRFTGEIPMLIESKNDCPPVEKFLWDKVAKSCGDFEGLHGLSFADLCHLRSLCDHQIDLYRARAPEFEGEAGN